MTAVDYDAPVAENGDLTEKYFIIQKVLRELLPNNDGSLCPVCVACFCALLSSAPKVFFSTRFVITITIVGESYSVMMSAVRPCCIISTFCL